MSARATAGRPRLGCVLDVETAPDPDVVGLCEAREGTGRRRALHHVRCASVLAFSEDARHGDLAVLGVQSFHLGEMAEPELLACVDRALADPSDDASLLVTYNGAAHDLVALRQRAQRLWMFDLPRLAGWAAEDRRHDDMIYHYGARSVVRPSLADVCALLGYPLRRPRRARLPVDHVDREWELLVRKNRSDVAATFVAYAHASSWRRGCARPATSACVSLADWLSRQTRTSGLDDFAGGQRVELARTRLAHAVEKGGCACGGAAGRC